MLQKLTVTNYALIDYLEIPFSPGMSIITGETGAGKSILLGALSLLTGARTDTSALLDKTRKCVVEGEFSIEGYGLENFFTLRELDYQEPAILRREITSEGKSRSFINDTPVTLSILRELGTQMVEIHSQHETLTLSNSDFQMSVVDACANSGNQAQGFAKSYRKYQGALDKLSQLREQEQQTRSDEDYLLFQLNELNEGGIVEGEQEQLEQEQQVLAHSGEIISALNKAQNALEGEEVNPANALSNVAALLRTVSKYLPEATSLDERLASVQIELRDISAEMATMERNIHFDPERLETITARLDQLYRLMQKHRVSSATELLRIRISVQEQLDALDSLAEAITLQEQEIARMRTAMDASAAELHTMRIRAIPDMEKQLKTMLGEVGMKHAVLRAELQPLGEGIYNRNGSDRVVFLFSANKGIEYKELHKVASGGEMSRLMLCIKSMLASKSDLPTILFDEIDAGISGEIALRVAEIIRKMSIERQVIVITHLPQMAARGTDHWYVYKETGKRAVTRIRRLDPEERVSEIAKMLSGETPTRAAITNARELLGV